MSFWDWFFGKKPAPMPEPPPHVVIAPPTLAEPAPPRPMGSKAEKARQARGYRNRNPGNIDWSASNPWLGQMGKEHGGRFAVFETHEYGIRAMARLLQNYQAKHGLHTIRAIINRWAPPVENATGAYVDRVDAAMPRHGADDRLDLKSFPDLRELVEAIITVELGGQPYDAATIDAGVRLAL